ncbi:MAG TPA: hypothetical protein VKQ72_19575, partial [Aggregatilineales bacterium]|nr:hypothetical protein [Aggregatilineales bacterium]
MNNANNAKTPESNPAWPWMQRLLTMQKRYSDTFEQQRALNLWRITLLVIALLGAELILINVFGTLDDVNRLYFTGEILVAIMSLVGVMVLLNRGELIAACLLFVVELYVGVTFRQL